MEKKEKIKVHSIWDEAELKKNGFDKFPALWEDGMRTSGEKGTYEWWYMDGHLDDGSTIAVIFYTKPLAEINKPLYPEVEIDYTAADGSQFNKIFKFPAEEFSASKEQCDVRIGKNYFRGNLKEYEIFFEDEDEGIKVHLKITRQTESWRPGNGFSYYGDTGKYVGWVIAVPQGKVEASYTINGKTVKTKGSVYHDHNWGNAPMQELINHWYWSRAEIGPYTAINAYLCCPKAYDLTEWGNVLLAKDGKILMDNPDCQTFFRSTPHVQPVTGKLVSDVVKFFYDDQGNGFELTLTKDHNILNQEMIANKFIRALGKALQGVDIGYHRMVGKAELKIIKNGVVTEKLENDAAVWEMMSFAAPE